MESARARAPSSAGSSELVMPLGTIDIEAERPACRRPQGCRKGTRQLARGSHNPNFTERAKPEAVEKARADHEAKAAEAERLRAALERSASPAREGTNGRRSGQRRGPPGRGDLTRARIGPTLAQVRAADARLLDPSVAERNDQRDLGRPLPRRRRARRHVERQHGDVPADRHSSSASEWRRPSSSARRGAARTSTARGAYSARRGGSFALVTIAIAIAGWLLVARQSCICSERRRCCAAGARLSARHLPRHAGASAAHAVDDGAARLGRQPDALVVHDRRGRSRQRPQSRSSSAGSGPFPAMGIAGSAMSTLVGNYVSADRPARLHVRQGPAAAAARAARFATSSRTWRS